MIQYTYFFLPLLLLFLLYVCVWVPSDGPFQLARQSLPESGEIKNQLLATFSGEEGTLCTPDTFSNGEWVYQPLQLTSNTPAAIDEATGYRCNWGFAHQCYQRNNKSEFNRSKHMLDYTWIPRECHIVPFNAQAFAAHLADHPLLLVGDSITQLAFESMQCMLGGNLVNTPWDTNMTGGNTNMWTTQLVHPSKLDTPGSVSLGYIRSDFLVRLDDFKLLEPQDDFGYIIGNSNNFPWVHVLPRFKYIIINTGPHWTMDEKWGKHKNRKELLAAYTKAMRAVFDYLKDNIKQDQRVWIRSTPYGHAKCSQYKAPFLTPHPPTRKPNEFQWDMFEQFERIWKDWILEENDRRFMFLNVSTLSNMRGDVHSHPDQDCLHTCLPGPVDDWNRLLFHEIAKISAHIV